MTCALQDIIRAATQQSHVRLDAAVASVDLRRPDCYASFLRGQAEAVLPLEAALEANDIHELLPDWERRRRTPALEHDLASLDIDIDPLALPHLVIGEDDPAPEMLGVCYVLEGTRMSARVILARGAEEPDPAIIGATAYLRHGFGRRLWPTFLSTLEGNPLGHAHPRRVIAGAEFAFALFERTLAPITTAGRRAGAEVRAA